MAIKRNKRVAMTQEIDQVTQDSLEDTNTVSLSSKSSTATTKKTVTKKSTSRKSTKKTAIKKTSTRKKTTKSKKATRAVVEGVV